MKVNFELDTKDPADKLIFATWLQVITQSRKPAKPETEAPVKEKEPVKAEPAIENAPQPVESEVAEGPELDSAGEPWDAEKHSRTKSKTSDGKWRVKRQVSKAKTEEPKEPATAPNPKLSVEDFQGALRAHREKFDINRTKQVLKDSVGKDHPSEVSVKDYAVAIEALNADKGPKQEDLDSLIDEDF